MGQYTNEVATRYCKTCGKKTLHQIILEKKVSTIKAVGGIATLGLSLLKTGLKSDQESYICHECKNIN